MTFKLVPKKKTPLYCSFCGKEKDDVGYLVAGPCAFICNECVELCREIGHEILTVNALDNLRTISTAEGEAMRTGDATPNGSPQESASD